MRILFPAVEDPSDVRSWSGTPFHLLEGLRGAGVDVVPAGPLRERFGLPLKAVQLARNAVGRTTWSRLREPVLLAGYAAQVARAIESTSPDVVLAPGTLPIALLDTDVPIVTYTDATFAGLVDFYPDYTGLSQRYLRQGDAMERAALERATLAVYSSEWAARSAVEHYGVPEERVAVVPYGANVADPGARRPLRRDGECRLLLVGRGWERKGVDLAVTTAQRLRELGVPAVLDVVGSEPPAGTALPPFVTVHGTLEKDDPASAARLAALYGSAAFFLLPTRAECAAIVLAEAQAYGVPVMTAAVGGTTSMLRPGRSGWALPLEGFPVAAAERIARAWGSDEAYAALSREARDCYESTLSWPAAVASLLALIGKRVLSPAIADR